MYSPGSPECRGERITGVPGEWITVRNPLAARAAHEDDGDGRLRPFTTSTGPSACLLAASSPLECQPAGEVLNIPWLAGHQRPGLSPAGGSIGPLAAVSGDQTS